MKLPAILIAGLVAGCAGELENPARFAECSPGYVEQLFQAKCGECHGAMEPDAMLDLASPGVAVRVKGVQAVAMCEGRMIVEPQGADHLLLEKIEANPSCGSRMPLGKAALTPTETECVTRWIASLAETP